MKSRSCASALPAMASWTTSQSFPMRVEAAFPSDAWDFRICETGLVTVRLRRGARKSAPTVRVDAPSSEVCNAPIEAPFRELLHLMAVHSRCQFTFERDHSVSSRAQRFCSIGRIRVNCLCNVHGGSRATSVSRVSLVDSNLILPMLRICATRRAQPPRRNRKIPCDHFSSN